MTDLELAARLESIEECELRNEPYRPIYLPELSAGQYEVVMNRAIVRVQAKHAAKVEAHV